MSLAALLKYRVALITLLFGAFGGALTFLLQIDEMENYYRALAPLLALVVSLLISFLLKMKWGTKARNILKVIAAVSFVFLLISIFFYTRLFLAATFPFANSDGKTSYYVRGDKDAYTQLALDFKNKNPGITSDSEIIRNGFEGPHNKRFVWAEESISKNLLCLIAGYCVIVILFVGIISMLSEIQVLKYSQSTRKTSVQRLVI